MKIFRISKIFPTIFIITALIVSIWVVASIAPKLPEVKIKDSETTEEEMRAVWVPFMTLNSKNLQVYRDKASFKKYFDKIVEQSKARGINTLIVHVRSHGDAIYPSKYYPRSHLLTGTQGENPGYDPLKYMVKATHKKGLSFHAWINPLRIQVDNTPRTLCVENIYNVWKADENKKLWVLDWQGNKYYNPAIPEVRERIICGVKEIIENYDVDGIHLDDYFYPTSNADLDNQVYEQYCSNTKGDAIDLQEFRKSNINTLVRGIYDAIKAINPKIQFGISPQGNINNDMKMAADVHTWSSSKGYVDYLCPQVYVNFGHPVLPFDNMVNEWKKIITESSIKLYFGLAIYKAGTDSDKGTWLGGCNMLAKQIEYCRKIGCNGFMLYSYDYLVDDSKKEEVENVMKVFKSTNCSK